MIQLQEFSSRQLRRVRTVFTDIDDTLTTDGCLTAEAYTAMSNLQAAGVDVVPVTGRPAGWCDLIARLWPVRGVVGENGAFYFLYDRTLKHMKRCYADAEQLRADKREKLAAIGKIIISEVPGSAISADQQYRETDLAIDFAEDVSRLSDAAISQIVKFFTSNGATAKVSSIHVNGWIGQYDKLTMTRTFVVDCLNKDLEKYNDEFVFIGDSPNDAPMFEFFNNSVGVANVKTLKGRLSNKPKYVTRAEGGAGFAEVARALISSRS